MAGLLSRAGHSSGNIKKARREVDLSLFFKTLPFAFLLDPLKQVLLMPMNPFIGRMLYSARLNNMLTKKNMRHAKTTNIVSQPDSFLCRDMSNVRARFRECNRKTMYLSEYSLVIEINKGRFAVFIKV